MTPSAGARRRGAASSRGPRIQVRDFRPADLAKLERWYRGLEVHIARTAPHHLVVRLPPGYGRAYRDTMIRRARKNAGFVLIVEVDGHPSGFLQGHMGQLPPRLGRLELRPNLTGHIADVFVEEPQRGVGAGRALFREAERRLLALGCDNLVLGVAAGNARAQEFYRHDGFATTSLLMRKDVARAPPTWEEARRRRVRALRRAKGVTP